MQALATYHISNSTDAGGYTVIAMERIRILQKDLGIGNESGIVRVGERLLVAKQITYLD
jgi:hypothetical protein